YRSALAAINNFAIALNGFDGMRNGSQPFSGNGSVECGKIDRSHWLGAQHERIITLALAIELRFQGEFTEAGQSFVPLVIDSTFKQVHRCEIARIFQRPLQGERVS